MLGVPSLSRILGALPIQAISSSFESPSMPDPASFHDYDSCVHVFTLGQLAIMVRALSRESSTQSLPPISVSDGCETLG